MAKQKEAKTRARGLNPPLAAGRRDYSGRSPVVKFRCPAVASAKYQRAADLAGLSLSAWIRRTLDDELARG